MDEYRAVALKKPDLRVFFASDIDFAHHKRSFHTDRPPVLI
jgi:hypothetical protein